MFRQPPSSPVTTPQQPTTSSNTSKFAIEATTISVQPSSTSQPLDANNSTIVEKRIKPGRTELEEENHGRRKPFGDRRRRGSGAGDGVDEGEDDTFFIPGVAYQIMCTVMLH
ncbi:hypothetical protein L6452_13812 [Arctium lappa]|uniref:Uncharacterized protein n=1 Tax=Arctium lappa TaxID=4217 RepID=A0ACB9CJJ4_ARCLA|nr:hypothetical protein L6452_13812 [Arctium lappa]